MIRVCNTIHPDDYKDIAAGVDYAKAMTRYLKEQGARIEIPCDARWWEYGTAIQLYLEYATTHPKPDPISVLDIGSGWGVVGPTLARRKACKVIEYEPDQGMYGADRLKVNEILRRDYNDINIHGFSIFDMPAQQYDVVFCISVMEHIPFKLQLAAWRRLYEVVNPGGILFITTDCLPEKGKPYMFDELRAWNPTTADLKDLVDFMQELGLKVMGTPDYKYHGNYVHDQYSFFRVGFTKE